MSNSHMSVWKHQLHLHQHRSDRTLPAAASSGISYFLFDSGTGTGRAFDWSNIPKTDKPFFLAGGISESNVKQAIDTAKPFAVDVSSSVETNDYKDYKKMKRFMEMARYE